MFYFDNLNGNKILKSDMLNDIDAFFTTRGNFSFPDNFASRIISPIQTHSDHIDVVDIRDDYPDTDGLILTEPDTAVYLRFADCTPIIFYDQIHCIAAISHAGWRGTASRIAVKTVAKMVLNYSSKPENIIVLIGPAISKCCYEVSGEVKDKLLSTIQNIDGLYEGRNVDLKQINARQLSEIGIEKIDICPYCTSCNNDLFYSYRKENGTQERHYAVIKLNNTQKDS